MTIHIPDHIRGIAPYVPGMPIEQAQRQMGVGDFVKLASNENPLGPSPRAVAAIREAAERVHRYPDGSGHALREALSARLRFPAEQIVLGNGSTELVEVLAKTFLPSGRGAVVADQAFIMYRIAVLAMAAPLRLVPLRDERHDLQAMAAACDAQTALLYISNPNNPTGTHVGREALETFFNSLPDGVLAVVDEAYHDYVEAPDYPDGLDFLRKGRPIVVLRTFSKIHGLAGLRIGYAVCSREVARALEAVRSPFNTSAVAQSGAMAALADLEHIARSRAENAREARFLQAELVRRGVSFVPTVANFVLVRTPMKGEEAYHALLRQGVIVRPMDPYGYPDAVRVSIGRHEENVRFLEALDRALARVAKPGGTVGESS